MKISYIEKIGKNKLHITLEDSESFMISEKDWLRFIPEDDNCVDDTALSELFEDYFLPKAKYKALNLLKSRDHTRAELIRKLKNSGYPDKVIRRTLEYIDSYHYLNDVRFVENYITYRGRTKSRKELLYELSLKGLDKNLVQNTKAYKENCNDRDAVFALILKRWGDKPMPDEKEKNRMTRYLAHRGFSANDIFSVYRELDI